MNIEEIGSFDELAHDHADRWRQIVADSTVSTIFQTWEWTDAWWRHFNKGKRLWAFRFVEDGETVGYAALFLPARPSLFRTARFVGTGISDYLDLIAAPGKEDGVAEAFGRYLDENRRRWDWIDLQEVRPGSVADRLVGASAAIRAEPLQKGFCSYAPLAASWPAFLSTLSKKSRESIRYYTRMVEKRHNSEFRLADAETLEADLEDLFDLHGRRWNRERAPGVLNTRAVRDFHRDVAPKLLAAGLLRMHVLSVDGKTRAVNYCFQMGSTLYGYQCGFDPETARLGVGKVLMAHLIRHAIEADHAAELDLMRGDEAYKQEWKALDRSNARLCLTNAALRSAAAARAVPSALAVEQGLLTGMRQAGVRPRRLLHQIRTSVSPAAWFRRRPLGVRLEAEAGDP